MKGRHGLRLALLLCIASSPLAMAQVATAPAGAPGDEALFVLPGTRLSEHSTLADLQALYGAANVHVVDGPVADEAHAILFRDDPTRRAYVWFWDEEARSGIASIRVDDRESRWRGKHGVRIGMSLAELRRANAKPFLLSGFDAHGRAAVHDQWSPALDDRDGSVGALDVDEGEQMYFRVALGLRAPAAPDRYPHDDTVRSDDPRYPGLGEMVEVTGLGAATSLDDEW